MPGAVESRSPVCVGASRAARRGCATATGGVPYRALGRWHKDGDVTDWMTIRVALVRQAETPLAQPPGRVMLAHADHAFADLAEAIDTAFGRWDLTPLHQFEVEGRLVVSDAEDPDAEDSQDVTLGEVGLRNGSRFAYLFDLGEGWTHECSVEEVGVDPFDLAGDEPDVPVPVFGWGVLPDQYGRLTEDDDEGDDWLDTEPDDEDEAASDETDLEDWAAAESASWDVVASAIGSVKRTLDRDALATVTAALRTGGTQPAWAEDVLWAATGIDRANPPDDDEELWVALAAGVVEPAEGVPLDADQLGAWGALEPADWAGAVIELVRAGPGTEVTPAALLERIAACPEVEEDDLSDEGEATLLAGLGLVIDLWRPLGIVGHDGTLTALGHWGLPEALATAWDAVD
jgi:hypothetical protein